MSGLDLGQKIPESKVTISNDIVIWGMQPDKYGQLKPNIISRVVQDTTVKLQDVPKVKYQNSQRNAHNYWEARRMHFKSR